MLVGWTIKIRGAGGTLMVGAAALAGSALGGCGARASFDDPDPASQLAALDQAIESNDRSKIPEMIELLDSDDPAVRMFAILGLERMTGETMGYEFAAPEPERDAATERWVEWYKTGPAAGGTAGRAGGAGEGRDDTGAPAAEAGTASDREGGGGRGA